MKLIALRNFKAIKGVHFEKGHVFTSEQVSKILPYLEGLKSERLVFVMEDTTNLGSAPEAPKSTPQEPSQTKNKKKK